MTKCNFCKSILKKINQKTDYCECFFCESCYCLVWQKDFAIYQNNWKFNIIKSEVKFINCDDIYNGFAYEAFYNGFCENNVLNISKSSLFFSQENLMSIKFQKKPTFELIKKTIEKYFKLQNII